MCRHLTIIYSALFLFLVAGCVTASVTTTRLFRGEHSTQSNIELKGTIVIKEQDYFGEHLSELSGIAWDNDESILYAVSDEGILFHIQPVISHGRLVDAIITAAWPLKSGYQLRLKSKYRDSEGLQVIQGNNGVRGDSQLMVSFEGRPRVARYSVYGEFLGTVNLPDILEDRKNYYKPNKGLEGMAIHPTYGVITSPEYPLKESSDSLVTIYSGQGKTWKAARLPIENSSIVAMDVLSDKSVLILQRAYKSLLHPLTITLSRIVINDACGGETQRLCERVDIATLSTAQDWALDNFEGLSHHRKSAFFMISDNNDTGLQRTLLTYFDLRIL